MARVIPPMTEISPTRKVSVVDGNADPAVKEEFGVLEGTLGPDVVDVRTLYGRTGYFTFDPSFMATASCQSKITFIDGDEGVLLYRGYGIDELAERSDFVEVAYLLLYGELPTAAE